MSLLSTVGTNQVFLHTQPMCLKTNWRDWSVILRSGEWVIQTQARPVSRFLRKTCVLGTLRPIQGCYLPECDKFAEARLKYFKAEANLAQVLKQKSRVRWAVDGDENSAFFHRSIKGRIKRNYINGLLVNRVWLEDAVKVNQQSLIISSSIYVNYQAQGLLSPPTISSILMPPRLIFLNPLSPRTR